LRAEPFGNSSSIPSKGAAYSFMAHTHHGWNCSTLKKANKAALGNPLPAPSRTQRVATNLNLKRRGAPGSGCQASTFCEEMISEPTYRTIDEFPLKWRFTDPKYVELSDGHLAQVRPLAVKSSIELWNY